MRCLRTLLRNRWQDKVPDTEVPQRAESESIHAILLRSQLRWAGHVRRMDDSRLPKRLFYGEITAGQRSLGRPKKRYKDSLSLKESLKRCDIPYSTWEASAEDRPSWRSLVRAGVLAFEVYRIREKDQIRQRRKERSSNPQPGPAPSIPCCIATDTSARRLGSSAISAPTPPPSDSKSWSSSPAKDEHHHHHHVQTVTGMFTTPLLTHTNELCFIYGHVLWDSCVQYFNFVNSFLRHFSIKHALLHFKRFTSPVLSGQTGFVPGHLVQEVSSSSFLQPVSPVHFSIL